MKTTDLTLRADESGREGLLRVVGRLVQSVVDRDLPPGCDRSEDVHTGAYNNQTATCYLAPDPAGDHQDIF